MSFGKLALFALLGSFVMAAPSHATYDGWSWRDGGGGEHCRELNDVSQTRENLINGEIAKVEARLSVSGLTPEQQFSLQYALRSLQARKYLLLNARYQSVSDGESEHRCKWPDGHWPYPSSPYSHPWGH
jgi:hypothetical protein